MPTKTGVLIFEGGQPETAGADPGGCPEDSPRSLLARVRRWTTLDTLEKFRDHPAVDTVVVATDSGDLAREALRAGVQVHVTGRDFHFGSALGELATRHRLGRVVYLGGGSVPLLRPEEIDRLLGLAEPGARVFAANNVQSPDIVALGSTEGLGVLAGLGTDNETLFALADAGYERRLLPDTPTTGFDLDTPSDILFMAYEARRRQSTGLSPHTAGEGGGLGPRAAEGLAGLDLDLSALDRAGAVLARRYAAVTLIGRVSGVTMNHLNERMLLRLRVFSEERGMKALGRIERGEVRSLLGFVLDDLGPDYLVRRLEEMSEAVFWDTRVFMAHFGRFPDESDRFESDLGRPQRVRDPALRRLSEATTRAGIPFVLGGHSVVAGGLRLLAEGVLQG